MRVKPRAPDKYMSDMGVVILIPSIDSEKHIDSTCIRLYHLNIAMLLSTSHK